MRRHDYGGRSWLFTFNHGKAAVTIPADGFDLLTGREITGTLDLPAGSVAVIRQSQPAPTEP